MILFNAPSTNYSANDRTFESNALDASLSRIRVTLTRESWPGAAGEVIGSIALEVSLDGVNYPAVSGASIQLTGGVKQYVKEGNTITVTSEAVECDLPGVGLTTRKVRARCINSQTLRTAITVEGF